MEETASYKYYSTLNYRGKCGKPFFYIGTGFSPEYVCQCEKNPVFENKSEVRFIPTWQPVLERIAIALERIADNLDEQHQ